MIIVPDIRCSPDDDAAVAVEKAAAELGLRGSDIKKAVLTRESVDARHRKVALLRSVGFELYGSEEEKLKNCARARLANPVCDIRAVPAPDDVPPPVIAGFGPAGMFAGLLLARSGYRPVVLERGGSVAEPQNV